MYDVIVIGGGVTGALILKELSTYRLSVLLLEREDDVATGASRSNSGIVHAGYDCTPGTYKARFNVEGNPMFDDLCAELDVPFKRIGSLVLSTANRYDELRELEKRGIQNGVPVSIIDRDAIVAMEPAVADDIAYALYAPTAGVVSPYKLTIHAVDYAITNGAEVKLNSEVEDIEQPTDESHYTVICKDGSTYETRVIINCAGACAPNLNHCAGAEVFPKVYKRGDYFVLDSTEGNAVSHVLFPLPDKRGKGILVTPTADGNVLYGPSSIPVEHSREIDTTPDGLDIVREGVKRILKAPTFNKVIRVYAGMRVSSGEDFIVKVSKYKNNFIYLQGICSPGLSAAPAIAKYVVGKLSRMVELVRKDELKPLPHYERLRDFTPEELNAKIAANPAWGRIVCRCEKVTEAEVVEAIHSPLPAVTVDAIKRRVRAGMGRCQGGFCCTRVMEIISRETGIPLSSVKKGGDNSEIARFPVKEVPHE